MPFLDLYTIFPDILFLTPVTVNRFLNKLARNARPNKLKNPPFYCFFVLFLRVSRITFINKMHSLRDCFNCFHDIIHLSIQND